MIIQEFYSNIHGLDYSVSHFITRIRGICIIVTPDLISEVLHVSRVEFADYLSCDHLRTVSKGKLSYLFCETSSSWGDRQNTPCLGFAKGPRFLNMVMTFVLYPLSYYNSITESCAQFLLSLIERISIDFPFHFILFLIDVYKDMATHDKLSFLLLSRESFTTSLSLILSWITSPSCVPLMQQSLDRVRPSFDRSGHGPRRWLLWLLQLHPHLLLLPRVVWPSR